MPFAEQRRTTEAPYDRTICSVEPQALGQHLWRPCPTYGENLGGGMSSPRTLSHVAAGSPWAWNPHTA